ncbi:5'-3' exoribonuclease 1 [Pseudohyphozyma bogoriensis]|nr:5'-3' exoribonuclease 1 [Pseudohyphozyma bogoriensis]
MSGECSQGAILTLALAQLAGLVVPPSPTSSTSPSPSRLRLALSDLSTTAILASTRISWQSLKTILEEGFEEEVEVNEAVVKQWRLAFLGLERVEGREERDAVVWVFRLVEKGEGMRGAVDGEEGYGFGDLEQRSEGEGLEGEKEGSGPRRSGRARVAVSKHVEFPSAAKKKRSPPTPSPTPPSGRTNPSSLADSPSLPTKLDPSSQRTTPKPAPLPANRTRALQPTYVPLISEALSSLPSNHGTFDDIERCVRAKHGRVGKTKGLKVALKKNFGFVRGVGEEGGVFWKVRKGWERHCASGLGSERGGKAAVAWCVCKSPDSWPYGNVRRLVFTRD